VEKFEQFGYDTPEFQYIAVIPQNRNKQLVSSRIR